MTPAERFRHHADRFDALIAAVPADRWSAPSPCEGWTATDIVGHIADTLADLLGRMDFDRPEPTGDATVDWKQTRAATEAALADPARAGFAYDGYFGPTTFEQTVDTFYSLDLVVHRWDLARAAGLADHEAIEPAELARIRTDAEGFGEALRMPGVVGPVVEVPADADEQDRLLAWLGRDPSA